MTIKPIKPSEFCELRKGKKIYVRDPFSGRQVWYSAIVIEAPIEESSRCEVGCKVTDEKWTRDLRNRVYAPYDIWLIGMENGNGKA